MRTNHVFFLCTVQGYEIVAFAAGEKIKGAVTKETRLVVQCDDRTKGQKYSFRVLVRGLCGYGKPVVGSGYYPLDAGESSCGSLLFFSFLPLQVLYSINLVTRGKTSDPWKIRYEVWIANSHSPLITQEYNSLLASFQGDLNHLQALILSKICHETSLISIASSLNFQCMNYMTHECFCLNRLCLFVSLALVMTSPAPNGPTAGKQTGKKKGLNAAVWAVPVAIVGLIFILILAFFIRKSRRLERSMFALMTRRTMDDDGGVTFHSGIGRYYWISQSVGSISDALDSGLPGEKGSLLARTAAGDRA